MAKVTRHPGAKAPVIATRKKLLHAEHVEGQMIAAQRRQEQAMSLRTMAIRKLPWAKDVLEIQALILRREGWTYAQIAHTLEVDQTTAHALVDAGARLCIDEEPVTALRVHLLRLDGLLESWYGSAFRPAEIQAPAGVELNIKDALALVAANQAEVKTARDNAYLVAELLKLQDKVGTWLAQLPRRGQERKDEKYHAEMKSILLRADEYAPPARRTGSDMPHGLPQLDWRPVDVEDAPNQDARPGDVPQAPGGSGAETSPRLFPSKLW